jgi:hypothetical protein
MKYRLIRILLLTANIIVGVSMAIAQSDNDNHRKYWYYRSRLVNDFVKVGLSDGESMPFNQRGHDTPLGYNAANAELYLGDGTSTLGYYIALLATEYGLLKQNAQDTKKVIHELFCALNAINRVDYKAEGLWQAGTEKLNGFFVRDDIPGSFVTNNYSHFNYYDDGNAVSTNTLSRGFMSKMNCGANLCKSDWQNRTIADPSADISMSQDQLYNLLFGLAFVNKFVPIFESDNGNTFAPYSSETSLTKEARNIASRLINFVRASINLANLPCTFPPSYLSGWRIRNPTTCNLVPTGDDARAFSYPLAEIECRLNNQNIPTSTLALNVVPLGNCGNAYHDVYSSTAAYGIWNSGIKVPQVLIGNPSYAMDTRVFFSNLAAVCNCSYGKVEDNLISQLQNMLVNTPIYNLFNLVIGWGWILQPTMVTNLVPGYQYNNTENDILINAYVSGAPIDHAPLARQVLHGGNYYPNPNYSIQSLLNAAPCDDIYNFGIQNQSTFEWSSDQRLDHPNRRGQNPVASGEYNGIDYMLYHNLWYLYQKQLGNSQNIIDLSDVYVEQSSYSSGNINAYETITTYSTTFGTFSSYYWRAGKTIYFGPGTQFTGNNNFHAYIDGFVCATDLGSFRTSDSSIVDNDYPNNPYHILDDDMRELSAIKSQINSEEENKYVTELPLDENSILSGTKFSSGNKFAVYPNPATTAVRIYFSLEPSKLAEMTITDLVGRVVVKEEKLNNTDNGKEIDLSGLACGSYIVNLFHDGYTSSVKLVKTN